MYRARILSNPARIVIDLRSDVPTGGPDVVPMRGGEFVVLPIRTEIAGPDLSSQFSVVGWGRPNEATGVAVLRLATDEPGTGAPVEAIFTSAGSGTEQSARYGFGTTDWVLWGEFALTIDGLPPGRYELFMGENTSTAGGAGVYQMFTVSARGSS